MNTCAKCKQEKTLTKHHIFPKTHFGKRNNRDVVLLCLECHIKVENYILAVESFIAGCPFGERFKLQKQEYEEILMNLRVERL